jgi:RND family efflux transporter MFP subunit
MISMPMLFLSRPRFQRGLRRLAFAPTLLLALVARAVSPAVEVPVVAARPQAVAVVMEFDGVIEPVQQSTVAAQATGRIAQLAVKAGDSVRAGQLLATIDDRESAAALQRSDAQVAQADAELRNSKAQVQRTRELQAKGFVSAAALDTSESAFKAAQAGRDQAMAVRRQSALGQGFTKVLAPYDGRVLQTLAQTGDLAVPGKPILTLYAPAPLRAVVHVPSSRADAARAAAQVEVQVGDGQGGFRSIAPVSRTVLPAADPVAQTLEWRLDLPAAATRSLAPGQQVHVRSAAGQARRVVVPAGAVLRRGELTAVYVVAGSGAGFVLKAVRVGADHGAAGIEILAGLDAADLVAIDPVKAGLAGARPAVPH